MVCRESKLSSLNATCITVFKRAAHGPSGGAGSAHLLGIPLYGRTCPALAHRQPPPPPGVHGTDVRVRDVRVRLHVAYGQYGLVRA